MIFAELGSEKRPCIMVCLMTSNGVVPSRFSVQSDSGILTNAQKTNRLSYLVFPFNLTVKHPHRGELPLCNGYRACGQPWDRVRLR